MAPNPIQVDKDNIATVTFDLPGKVNVMNDDFMTAMDSIVESLESMQGALRGVVVTSAKSTFFAGGDLALMLRCESGDESFLTEHFNRLKSYFRRLEQLGVPVVAAINGTALGGGYELCLSCHYRVALDNPRAQIGLPEVDFGILPAAGGVVRLTKLLGPDEAAPFLLDGKRVDPATARSFGLVDEIAGSIEEMHRKARTWILSSPAPIQRWEDPGQVVLDGLGDDPVTRLEHNRQVAAKENPAIAEILSVVNETLSADFDKALAQETDGFVRLVLSDNAKKRISDFFAANRAKNAATA